MDDKIDIRDFINAIWSRKWFIVSVTSVFAVASVAIALAIPNRYVSTALLAPNDGADLNVGSLLGGSALASIAGLRLGGGFSRDNQLAIEVLQSQQFLADFIERRNILPDLMAAKGWDAATDTVLYNENLYNPETNKWLREVEPPYRPEPNLEEAYKQWLRILTVSEPSSSGTVSIAIEHFSPKVASQWVTWLVEDLNNTIKQQDISEAKRAIKYLTAQVNSTPYAELKTKLFELIQSQTEKAMLIETREEYVFKTIDPANIPVEKDSPSRALLCIQITMLGSVVSVFWVVVSFLATNRSVKG